MGSGDGPRWGLRGGGPSSREYKMRILRAVFKRRAPTSKACTPASKTAPAAPLLPATRARCLARLRVLLNAS